MKEFVDKERLKKLCKITKLEISHDEEELFLDLINGSLESLVALDEVETEGLEPLINPYQITLTLQPDIVAESENVNTLMKSAPTCLYNYFVVPKVIDNK